MSIRERAWLATLAHISTIVTALVTLGVTGALGVGFQALLAVFFTLSTIERVLLGVCGFFIALGLLLFILKYVRNRWFSASPQGIATSPTSTPSSPNQTQEPEAERLTKQLEESERERRSLVRKLTGHGGGGELFGGTLTQDIPKEAVSARHVPPISFYLMELLALADEGPRLVGWTFEGCTIIGGSSVVVFTGSTVTEGVNTVQGSPDTVLYETVAYGDEAVGIIQLDGCTFKGCTFGRIGLAGTSEDQQWFRDKFEFTLP